ncbi:MAG: helix-turn-helix transcriptional regulator [Thermoanaerobaculia bacterium]
MLELRHAVDAYLRRCFSQEESPRVAELAVLLRLPRERLSRDFASAYGVPLSSYLKRRQIRQAQRLLASSELSTTRIGYLCGFGTRRTFYRAFRRGTGLSPDQYRRMHAHEMSLAAPVAPAPS